MRKYKQAYNRKYGICVLVLALVMSTAGITRSRDARAEEVIHSNNGGKIIATQSIYIANRKTLNVYPERPKYNINLSEENQNLIFQLCIKNEISYELVLAVFHYESKFNPNAINTSNKDKSRDVGISQLNNRFTNTYRDYAIKYCELSPSTKFDVVNVDHNIRAGIGILVYLRDYWKQRGVRDDLLMIYVHNSYNLGIVGFQKYIKQTGNIDREYSRQILLRKEKLETTHTL